MELLSCDLLREGAPIEPVPPVTHWKPEAVVREHLNAVTLLLLRSLHVEASGCCDQPMRRRAAAGMSRGTDFQNGVPHPSPA